MENIILDKEKEAEEENSFFKETILAPKNYGWVEEEVIALIFKADKSDFDLCGKTMTDWVRLACVRMQNRVLEEPREENFLSTVKNNAENKKIALVLYSDTPLLSQQTILNALDYFSSHDMNALTLPRGYIFKVEYLKTALEIVSTARKNFAPEEFKIISSAADISDACEIMWNKIRAFHKQSGVILKGEQTIFIDADVHIESGVVIEPNNIIKGQSVIEEGVVLKCGNYIEDTIIKAGSVLQGKNIISGGEE